MNKTLMGLRSLMMAIATAVVITAATTVAWADPYFYMVQPFGRTSSTGIKSGTTRAEVFNLWIVADPGTSLVSITINVNGLQKQDMPDCSLVVIRTGTVLGTNPSIKRFGDLTFDVSGYVTYDLPGTSPGVTPVAMLCPITGQSGSQVATAVPRQIRWATFRGTYAYNIPLDPSYSDSFTVCDQAADGAYVYQIQGPNNLVTLLMSAQPGYQFNQQYAAGGASQIEVVNPYSFYGEDQPSVTFNQPTSALYYTIYNGGYQPRQYQGTLRLRNANSACELHVPETVSFN